MDKNYILEMEHIDKSFPGVKALVDVHFKVKNCEIHGLVGENGAGKSTLMKILTGLYQHDAGTIYFCGKKHNRLNAKKAGEIGISIIHQERLNVPFLTVAETLFLGIEPSSTFLKLISRKKMERKSSAFIKEELGVDIEGNSLMGNLTVGEQQIVQIARALLTNPKLVVFDEPTAVLAKKECEMLFKVIKELSKRIAVVYISHYFGEILDICDRVTVLRNGQNVCTVSTEGLTINDLVVAMIGRDISSQYPPKDRYIGEEMVKIENLSCDKAFSDVSFTVKSGEILGLTGLMGSGHTAVGEALYYENKGVTGTVTFKGKPLEKVNPMHSVSRGIAYVPEDRRKLGAIQRISVRENITLSNLSEMGNYGVINSRKENKIACNYVEQLDIKTPSVEQQTGLLSGGNQQKVVISRSLCNESSFFILNQPTSGVDVGARLEIYNHICNMARQGAAILVISQDIQELVGLSDRIITMYRGKIADEFIVSADIADQVNVSMMGGGINED